MGKLFDRVGVVGSSFWDCFRGTLIRGIAGVGADGDVALPSMNSTSMLSWVSSSAGGVMGVSGETEMLSELLAVVSWLEFFVMGELCNVTWTGGFCFVEDSIPNPASLRNLVGVEATLCTDAEEGGLVTGWEGDKMVELLVGLDGGGPDGVLLGDTLDFALMVEKVLSFFVADRGISEAARLCLTKRL